MKIGLPPDVYQKLLDHVPQGSARGALERATKMPGSFDTDDQYWIECTEQEADVFHETASKHFPMQVREIQQAIVTARR